MMISWDNKGLFNTVIDFFEEKLITPISEDFNEFNKTYDVNLIEGDTEKGVAEVTPVTGFLIAGAYDTHKPFQEEHILHGVSLLLKDKDWEVFLPIHNGQINFKFPSICLSMDTNTVAFVEMDDLMSFFHDLTVYKNDEIKDVITLAESEYLSQQHKETLNFYVPATFFEEIKLIENNLSYCIWNYKNAQQRGCIKVLDIFQTTKIIQKWDEDVNGNKRWKSEKLNNIYNVLNIYKIGNYFFQTNCDLIMQIWEEDPVLANILRPQDLKNIRMIDSNIFAKQLHTGSMWIGAVFKEKELCPEQINIQFIEIDLDQMILLNKASILNLVREKALECFDKESIINESIIPSDLINNETGIKSESLNITKEGDPKIEGGLFQEFAERNKDLLITEKSLTNLNFLFNKHPEDAVVIKETIHKFPNGVTLDELMRQENWYSLSKNNILRQIVFNSGN